MISEDIITVQGICNALVSPLISCSDPKKKLSELYDKEVALKRVATISQRTDAIASKAVGEVLQRKSRDLQTGWKSFRTILTAGLDQDEICLEPLQQGAKKMKVLLQELFQITHLPSVIQTAPTSSAPTAFANEELTPEQEWQNYQVQESQEKLSAESPATVLQVKSFTFELVRGRLGKNLQQLAIERSEMLFAQEAFLKLFFLYAIQKKIDFDALVFADQLPDGQFAKIAADLQPYLQEE
ncbi:MAG TPA: hypothetical protein VN457_06405, partial [Chlamydiales bacterium]|nr:hypothetical protein [Chlamydiales bacterium]